MLQRCDTDTSHMPVHQGHVYNVHDTGMLNAELDDNRMHPASSAPRCLPCGYEDPLQTENTANEFQAPKVASY